MRLCLWAAYNPLTGAFPVCPRAKDPTPPEGAAATSSSGTTWTRRALLSLRWAHDGAQIFWHSASGAGQPGGHGVKL